jgi:hypothetical protein
MLFMAIPLLRGNEVFILLLETISVNGVETPLQRLALTSRDCAGS